MNDLSNNLAVTFSFQVVVEGVSEDNAFQEASGLEIELDVETVSEGGENTFEHSLPKGPKHSNLVLKRGIVKRNSRLVTWVKEVLEGGFEQKIKPANIKLNLLDQNGEPAASWSLTSAWPVKWSVGTLDAAKNVLAVETIEFAYNSLKRTL